VLQIWNQLRFTFSRATARPRVTRVQPTLECLEHRLVPANFTVMNTNDAGAGSLRQAVLDLNNSQDATNNVNFGPGAMGAITLTTQLPAIDKNVSINGPGQGVTIARSQAQGTPNFGILTINANKTVTISGLTIAQGLNSPAGLGGGIKNLGTLTLTNVALRDNQAAVGGGIYNTGTLTVTNCMITNNRAGDGGGMSSAGGTVTITNTSISGNSTSVGAGGGILVESTTMTITGAMIIGNSAVWRGGGISNELTGVLTIAGSTTITGNRLSTSDGGGISNIGTLTVSTNGTTSVTLTNNTATGHYGGAIHNSGTATITAATISSNGARAGAGIENDGTLTISRSTISNNTATAFGGGFFNSGTQTVTNSTISWNRAPIGAGIHNTGTQTLRNNTIANNMAVGGGMGRGGGVFNDLLGTTDIANTIIAANFADQIAFADADGVFASLGHNLIGIADGSSGWLASDFVGTSSNPLNPMLSQLGSYGGPTQTMKLLGGSAAFNAGDNALAPDSVDQRGFARIVNNTIDIGAVEMQPGE